MPETTPNLPLPVDSDTIKKKIAKSNDKINGLKEKRKAINADISAIVQDLKAQGINPKAFKFVSAYAAMNEDEQQQVDITLDIVREALGFRQTDFLHESRKAS